MKKNGSSNRQALLNNWFNRTAKSILPRIVQCAPDAVQFWGMEYRTLSTTGGILDIDIMVSGWILHNKIIN